MGDTKQYFTLEEANLRLPLVKRIVQDIVSLYKDVHERRRRLEEIKFRQTGSEDGASLYREEVGEIEKEVKQDVQRLDEFLGELKSLNVQIKDPAIGVVDFPSMQDGREVCLCWQPGEEEIGFWREVDAGFAGRQSLFEGSIAAPDESSNPGGE
ncbi:MAG: DUF2203 domain-containing protein [Planctomycetaceae bacterium]